MALLKFSSHRVPFQEDPRRNFQPRFYTMFPFWQQRELTGPGHSKSHVDPGTRHKALLKAACGSQQQKLLPAHSSALDFPCLCLGKPYPAANSLLARGGWWRGGGVSSCTAAEPSKISVKVKLSRQAKEHLQSPSHPEAAVAVKENLLQLSEFGTAAINLPHL